MKTPQRKFVVEFKSGRRQRAETKSIWGDTDLKAFVRKAEDDAPHLFGPKEARGSSVDDGHISPQPMNLGSASAADAARTTLLAVDEQEAKAPKQREDNLAAVDTIAQAPVSQRVQQPRKPLKDTARKRAHHTVTQAINGEDRINEDLSAQSVPAAEAVSLQEVAALDLENRRLRKMLSEALRAQNVQIRRMLERFDAG
ncbi:hypothetical protein [Rhizobium tubonense]|uniref:Uncharacterized protein n=1 Tax=Rhizobium tubonense TaxID=484088 RepID=A0A2W4CZU8_9HYPH|nr:hypothetical protein [Rhizobium tubonense]PZM15575.1 hypothetical protein CPY51_07045 [Rhizobium tubonense]